MKEPEDKEEFIEKEIMQIGTKSGFIKKRIRFKNDFITKKLSENLTALLNLSVLLWKEKTLKGRIIEVSCNLPVTDEQAENLLEIKNYHTSTVPPKMDLFRKETFKDIQVGLQDIFSEESIVIIASLHSNKARILVDFTSVNNKKEILEDALAVLRVAYHTSLNMYSNQVLETLLSDSDEKRNTSQIVNIPTEDNVDLDFLMSNIDCIEEKSTITGLNKPPVTSKKKKKKKKSKKTTRFSVGGATSDEIKATGVVATSPNTIDDSQEVNEVNKNTTTEYSLIAFKNKSAKYVIANSKEKGIEIDLENALRYVS